MKRKAVADIDLMYASKRRKLQKAMTKKLSIPKRLKGFYRTGGYFKRFTSLGETKYYDSTINNYTIDATGEVIPITTGSSGSGSSGTILQIPQGDTEFQRNGRKIALTNLSYTGYVSNDGSLALGQVIQLCLVWDRQCNGALPFYTDIFQTNTINSFNNLSNSSRFKIVKKIRIPLNPVSNLASTTSIPRFISIKGNVKLRMPIEYDSSSTTGVITSIKSNNLFWVAISTSDDLSGLFLNTRVRFKDN